MKKIVFTGSYAIILSDNFDNDLWHKKTYQIDLIMTDKNENIIDDRIDEIIDNIQQSFSGPEKLIAFIESIEKDADQYLETVDTTSILEKTDWIKSADTQNLIRLLSSNAQFKSSNEEEMIKHIQIIKDMNFKDLSKISFIEEGPVIAAFLYLIIECFKKDLKKKKIPARIKKEIFIYLYVNEIKSIVNELKPLLISGDNSPVNYELVFEISTSIHRLGYLSGLLHSEEKFKIYHHSLTSRKHRQAGLQPKQTFVNELQNEIKKHAQKLYDAGCEKRHEQVAKDIRQVVLDFIGLKKRGQSFNIKKLDPWFQGFINQIQNYHNQRRDLEHLEKIFKKRRRNDIFLESVKAVCPEHLVRGKKQKK